MICLAEEKQTTCSIFVSKTFETCGFFNQISQPSSSKHLGASSAEADQIADFNHKK